MTFTDMCTSNSAASETTSIEKRNLTIGHAVERCLSRAVAAHRVTVGIQECAKLLGCAPERVMLCVIPDMAGSADVGLHIQHTLVRSFCWENDIRLLTVKNCDKLQNIVNSARATQQEVVSDPLSSETMDTTSPSSGATTTTLTSTTTTTTPSCLLVEAPAKNDELNVEEDFVCNYHDTIIYSDIYPKPVIQLPV